MWCVIDSNTGKNLINIREDEFDNEIKIHIIERIGKVGAKVDRCDGV